MQQSEKLSDIIKTLFTAFTYWTWQAILFSFIQAIPVFILWNIIVPTMFPFLSSITFVQAFGLILLLKVLSRAWLTDALNSRVLEQISIAKQQNLILYNLLLNTLPASEGNLSNSKGSEDKNNSINQDVVKNG